MKKSTTILGLMSGSSLDGLDIAAVKISHAKDRFSYQILAADTVAFSSEWVHRLSNLPHQSARNLAKTHCDLGRFMAKAVLGFLQQNPISIDYIASHGHTVFHAPQEQFTTQIGCGATLATLTRIPSLCDFRSADVAAGGEGAPLAPVADSLLYPEYDIFLNLGGIANISYKTEKIQIGLDTSACNQVLNSLSQSLGYSFDNQGKIAEKGNVVPSLFEALDKLDFHHKKAPKSLSNDYVQNTILPLILDADCSVEDKLHTFVHHIAWQILKQLPLSNTKILVTGGGAYNLFLISTIKKYLEAQKIEVHLPNPLLIDYKESVLMALLGFLRVEGIPNSLKAITGANFDTINGGLYLPSNQLS